MEDEETEQEGGSEKREVVYYFMGGVSGPAVPSVRPIYELRGGKTIDVH